MVFPYPQLERPDAEALQSLLGRITRFLRGSVDSAVIDQTQAILRRRRRPAAIFEMGA